MSSPNRLKIWKLFDEAHSTNSLIHTAHNFSEIFNTMKWEWNNFQYGKPNCGPEKYVPNYSHIYQHIKNLLIDLKTMIDKCSGPIRKTDEFFISSGRIKCRVFYMDNEWNLSIDLIVNGSHFSN